MPPYVLWSWFWPQMPYSEQQWGYSGRTQDRGPCYSNNPGSSITCCTCQAPSYTEMFWFSAHRPGNHYLLSTMHQELLHVICVIFPQVCCFHSIMRKLAPRGCVRRSPSWVCGRVRKIWAGVGLHGTTLVPSSDTDGVERKREQP